MSLEKWIQTNIDLFFFDISVHAQYHYGQNKYYPSVVKIKLNVHAIE